MKRFVADALVKPLFGILFFLAFGLGFIFGGYQTIDVAGTRDAANHVVFDYAREHFWGFVKFSHRMEGVRNAELMTKTTRRSGKRPTVHSAVFLVSEKEKQSLSGGSSNVDKEIKQEMVSGINAFIQDPAQRSFSKKYEIRNIFFWVGLPFFLLGLVALVGWPMAILDALKKNNRPR
jgi:hypothetical protein